MFVMKNIIKFLFLFVILSTVVYAKRTVEVDTKDTSYIFDCNRQENSKNCPKAPTPTKKLINQNDLLFLGERLYMDNYNSLNFSSSTRVLENLR